MTDDVLQNASAALVSFAEKLGDFRQVLIAAESPEKIALSLKNVSSERLRSLDVNDLRDLSTTFGSALKVDVYVGDLPILSVSDSITDDILKSFEQDIGESDVAKLTINIDKNRLLSLWKLFIDSMQVYIFLFPEAAENLLAHSLSKPSELEDSLWKNSLSEKVVLLVNEKKVYLDGPFWAAIGGDQLHRLGEISSTGQEAIEQVARVRLACKESVRWDNPFLNQLVPHCFRLQGDIPKGSRIANLMISHWINTCILYTADRVQLVGNDIVGTYATERSRCQVRLLEDTLEDDFPLCENVTALGDIAEWAYSERWGSDRLRMVQVDVSRALAYGAQPRNAGSLVVHAKGILDELEWHWKSFIAGEIDRFAEEERTLEGEVAQAVEGFDAQVAEMIKSLSGSMLAAVGVLIGSIIAAAFKGTFNPKVFSLGIWGYVVYLILFPGLYNMSHHVMRFVSAGSIFEKRRKRFQRLLAPDIVSAVIDGHVWWAKCRFWAWFSVTIMAFVGVIVACFCADSYIPTLLSESTSSQTVFYVIQYKV